MVSMPKRTAILLFIAVILSHLMVVQSKVHFLTHIKRGMLNMEKQLTTLQAANKALYES